MGFQMPHITKRMHSYIMQAQLTFTHMLFVYLYVSFKHTLTYCSQNSYNIFTLNQNSSHF